METLTANSSPCSAMLYCESLQPLLTLSLKDQFAFQADFPPWALPETAASPGE